MKFPNLNISTNTFFNSTPGPFHHLNFIVWDLYDVVTDFMYDFITRFGKSSDQKTVIIYLIVILFI